MRHKVVIEVHELVIEVVIEMCEVMVIEVHELVIDICVEGGLHLSWFPPKTALHGAGHASTQHRQERQLPHSHSSQSRGLHLLLLLL